MNIKELNLRLKQIYKELSGFECESVTRMPLSGSNRMYFRLEGGSKNLIATFNEDMDENKAFLYLANHLRNSGVNVPNVLYHDEKAFIYVQEDLGDLTLFDYIEENRNNPEKISNIYRKVIEQMPALQYKSSQNLDFSICYPREAFDSQSIQWDLNYFKYFFLKTTHIPFHEQKLENEFQKLIELLLETPSDFFLFRDFQSRNIMVKDDDVYFIDFQGGRKGALQYDLASLLFEAKTRLSPEFRKKMLDYYLVVFSQQNFFNSNSFNKYFPFYVLVRLLQAFGAYGYRGVFEKKPFFVQSIDPAIDNLLWVKKQGGVQELFPYLCEIIDLINEKRESFKVPEYSDQLTVSITSFSYRQGIPDDWSGNGGGFVFDCRALHNPGRYEELKTFTGREKPIIEFLKKNGEVEPFLDDVFRLVGKSVAKYLQRGFNHLAVNFGCTGGRHRSVYCAEQLFQYLKMNFELNLRLFHRELDIKEDHVKNDV